MFSPESLTLDDYFKKWFAVKRGIRSSTRKNYEIIYRKRISPYIGRERIARLSLTTLKRFYIYLNEEVNFSPATINLTHMLLNQVFDSAVAEHIIRDNPAKRAFKEFRSVSKKSSGKKSALTKEEQEVLLSFVSKNGYYKKWCNMFVVFLGTGLRVGELTGLCWNDIDFENDTISVSRTLTYYDDPKDGGLKFRFHKPKTSSGNRIVPMSSAVKSALIAEKSHQEEKQLSGKISVDGISNFCFLTHYGRPYFTTSINKALDNLVNAFNKNPVFSETIKLPKITCHTFRHSFATRMFEAGVEPKIIQEIMGHSSLSITMDIYTDVSVSVKKRDIEIINSFLCAS